MPTQSPALLLAIKPWYAEAILAERKRLELRRRAPGAEACSGLRVVLYASQPVCAIVGVCDVRDVVTMPPADLWTHGGASTLAGVSKRDYDAYFAGCGVAHAMVLASPRRVRGAIVLAALRARVPGFRPPQSWCWLREERARDAMLLRTLVPAIRRAG